MQQSDHGFQLARSSAPTSHCALSRLTSREARQAAAPLHLQCEERLVHFKGHLFEQEGLFALSLPKKWGHYKSPVIPSCLEKL